jgi:DNA-binding Lrp family transcriptional regulator
MDIDKLDAAILELLEAEPRISILEIARRLSIARGTVQARIDRLTRSNVITGFGPSVNPAAFGYVVTAFVTAEISQDNRDGETVDYLRSIPEVLEIHTTTGIGDLFIRVVARSNSDLQRVIDLIVKSKSIARTSTVIALATEVEPRTLPLVRAAATQTAARESRARAT